MSGQGGFVYFLRFNGDGPVKIGSSTDPENRLRYFRTATPYEVALVAKAPGTVASEKALHRHFAGARLRLEWFSPVPELIALIERVAANGALPVEFQLARPLHVSTETPHAHVIDRIGGVGPLSKALSFPFGTVYRWRRTGFIPAPHMNAVLAAGRSLGFDIAPRDFFKAQAPA